MRTLLEIALSNAAVATVLAVVAFGVTVVFRRPALAHAAWLLVLLKLLTPPLFTVPVELPRVSAEQVETVDEVPQVRVETPRLESGYLSEAGPVEAHVETHFVPETVETPVPLAPEVVEEAAFWAAWADQWPRVLLAVWAGGSALCLMVIASRLWRFRRVLRFARLAPRDVQDEARSLCDELEIAPCPGVWFVPGGVCPMLIGLGRRSRILVPRDLWGRLDEEQRATLLVHELAHLRRGDQWVRVIELLVTVLYWWHPVAWFARRELREAEEQCCDAWVVWAMPRSARDYAVALMEAIDFTTRSRPVAPVLGSGMGEFHHLRRRLIMIKQGKVAKALTWSGFGAMCGVGALLLPLSPTFGDDAAPAAAPAALPAPAQPAADVAPVDAFSVVERLEGIDPVIVLSEDAAAVTIDSNIEFRNDVLLAPGAENPGEPGKPGNPDGREDDEELAAVRREVQELSKALAQAHARMAQIESRRHAAHAARANGFARRVQPPRVGMAPGGMQGAKPPMQVHPAKPGMPGAPGAKPIAPTPAKKWAGPDVQFDKKPTVKNNRGGGKEAQEERLDELEDRIAELLEEVRGLKRNENRPPTEVLPAPRPEPRPTPVPTPSEDEAPRPR